jgi:hypothetical protein
MSKFQNPSIKKIELTKKNFVIKIKAIGLTTCDNLVSSIKKLKILI